MADPALQPARTGLAITATFRKLERDTEVLLDDGTWGPVRLLAWQRDYASNWQCQLRWDDGDGHQAGWFHLRAGEGPPVAGAVTDGSPVHGGS